jgi:hypothetical protein
MPVRALIVRAPVGKLSSETSDVGSTETTRAGSRLAIGDSRHVDAT